MILIISILLIMLFVFSVSLTWRIGCLILLLLVWSSYSLKHINPGLEWVYWLVLGVLCFVWIISLPRYLPLKRDRIRHYYLNKQNKIKRPPFHHWLLNAILPEEELCNIGIKFSKFVAPMIGIGKGLKENLKFAKANGTLKNMLRSYWKLERNFENPMSAAYVQGLNQFLKEKNRSFYLIRPKNYNRDRTYPLIVFCHGYLGNWKLYTGVLSELENCIIISIGTQDLSGIFLEDEVKEIHNLYIPLLRSMGYKIHHEDVTIMGLSNGRSAVGEAYKKYSKLFKNIVYISTRIKETFPIPSKVLIVGGDQDPSAVSMINGYKAIRQNKVDVRMIMIKDATHFAIATHYKWITNFLNKELGLVRS